MIIGSRIDGKEKNIFQNSPLKEVFIANPNLTLIEAFKIVGSTKESEVNSANEIPNPSPMLNQTPFSYEMQKEETVKMEEEPVNAVMDTIAPPTIEELNETRRVLSQVASGLQKITDELDEIIQLANKELDKVIDYNNEQTGMKM